VGQDVGWTGILTLVKVTIGACDDRRRASLGSSVGPRLKATFKTASTVVRLKDMNGGAAKLKYAELIPQKRAIVHMPGTW